MAKKKTTPRTLGCLIIQPQLEADADEEGDKAVRS